MDKLLFVKNIQAPKNEFLLDYLDCTRILTAAGLFCYPVPWTTPESSVLVNESKACLSQLLVIGLVLFRPPTQQFKKMSLTYVFSSENPNFKPIICPTWHNPEMEEQWGPNSYD